MKQERLTVNVPELVIVIALSPCHGDSASMETSVLMPNVVDL